MDEYKPFNFFEILRIKVKKKTPCYFAIYCYSKISIRFNIC